MQLTYRSAQYEMDAPVVKAKMNHPDQAIGMYRGAMFLIQLSKNEHSFCSVTQLKYRGVSYSALH